ncbi:MAG: NDP-hexose 4-ketoreductase [Actinomycetia bacterium]|nr:NDP-hexose 4-ketoreductase [Actinomycetes bacterium]
MFERFTAKARRAIVLAQEEAGTLNHNYIGTEHILLGLLHEAEGIGPRALIQFGLTLEDTRTEVTSIVGAGKKPAPGKHIPFTPRAKKVLELALREALSLHHNYIGTEHILLGLIREGDGVAAQVLRKHGDLLQLRTATLDLLQATYPVEESRGRNWLRRVAVATRPRDPGDVPTEEAEQSVLSATPAADATLSTAARMAGEEPVGSHHLLLAALTDANSAAARVLASLGVDLTRAKDALHNADIAGTSDELPEEAGRRQMNFQVTPEVLTIVATDQTLVKSASAALAALGEQATPGGVIRGADLTGLPAVNLAKAWTALHDALLAIATRAGASTAAGAGIDTATDSDTDTGTGTDTGAQDPGTHH